MGSRVLVECMSSGLHILQSVCFIGRHFIVDGTFYSKVCIIGGHVLQFKMSYWSTCLQEGIS